MSSALLQGVVAAFPLGFFWGRSRDLSIKVVVYYKVGCAPQ